MAKVIGDISMSVAGFTTGPDPGPERGLGHGGEPLHDWACNGDTVDAEVLADPTDATGGVVTGRKLFDVIDGPHGWSDEVGYGAREAGQQPVLVVPRNPPEETRLSGD